MYRYVLRLAAAAAAALVAACATTPAPPGKPEYMLVGVDKKVVFKDDGNLQLLPPGNDSIAIVDIGTDPAHPRVVASLPLMNSIFGPPTLNSSRSKARRPPPPLHSVEFFRHVRSSTAAEIRCAT